MVRNLNLNFVFKKEGTRVIAESESVGLAAALAAAETQKGRSARVVSLSRVSFPFWIVQTSPTKSIVLTANSSTRVQFQFTDMKGANEIRRIISSDLSQASDIPNVVTKIQPLLDSTESNSVDIGSLSKPSLLQPIGDFVLVSDPSAKPNRVEIKTDSAAALKRTEEFQKISETAKLRIESTEALQRLVKENFIAQTTILDNLSKLEHERGGERVRAMEERTRQEIAKLTKDKDDKLYDLREKHKMNLRAMIADFTRSMNDLEQYFGNIIDEIRDARSKISQKEADTEGAIAVYSSLVNSLKATLAKSQQPIEGMEARKIELENRVKDAQMRYEADISKVEETLQNEIEERQKRIGETRNETDLKSQEMGALDSNVRDAIKQTEQTIDNRILAFQQEFLNLMAWTIDNNSIRELAPLTLLDIHTYVVKFDDQSHKVLTPIYLPEDNLLGIGPNSVVSREFDEAINNSVDDWLKNDPAFKEIFERACSNGNMLLTSGAEQLLVGGLEDLMRRRLLQRDDIERLLTIWSRYSGKCPKCGATVEAGSQFCQKCGSELIK